MVGPMPVQVKCTAWWGIIYLRHGTSVCLLIKTRLEFGTVTADPDNHCRTHVAMNR